MSSAAAFDQALALVHDTLLHKKANDGTAAIPLESLRRLAEVAGSVRAVKTAPKPAERAKPVGLSALEPRRAAAPATKGRPARLSEQVRAHLPPEVAGRTAPRASSADKAERMAKLRKRAEEQLALSSTPLVFGTGSLDAEVIFIGDSPAPEDEAAGEPFRDEAGQMMTKIIATMGLQREEVYLVNLLQTRPDLSTRRALDPGEVTLHLPYLVEQISIVEPRCLVALGGAATEALLRTGQPIDRLRGHWQRYQGLPLMPTYHVIYLHTTKSPLHKRQVWTDMLKVLEKLERPISAKQRSYFQTARR